MRWRRPAGPVPLIAALMTTVPLTAPGAQETVYYGYDGLGRVTSVCYVESAKRVTYSYDASGNRTAKVTASTACGPPNQPPQAVDDVRSGTFYNFDTVIVDVLLNDSDPEGDPLTITSASCVSSGCIVVIDAGKLSIIGTTSGNKIVTYSISDGRGGTDSAMVTVAGFQPAPGCLPGQICF